MVLLFIKNSTFFMKNVQRYKSKRFNHTTTEIELNNIKFNIAYNVFKAHNIPFVDHAYNCMFILKQFKNPEEFKENCELFCHAIKKNMKKSVNTTENLLNEILNDIKPAPTKPLLSQKFNSTQKEKDILELQQILKQAQQRINLRRNQKKYKYNLQQRDTAFTWESLNIYSDYLVYSLILTANAALNELKKNLIKYNDIL